MKRISKCPYVMLAGGLLFSSVGCITGTNTFSSVSVPATQYCHNDMSAPVFDIPSALTTGSTLSTDDAVCDGEQNVSLKP